MSTHIRESYEGQVDGVKVVSGYRAFAEDAKPYVITLDLGKKVISTALQPMTADEDFTATEAEDFNRRNTLTWVETLTELVEKAQAWDAFVADVAAVEADETMVPSNGAALAQWERELIRANDIDPTDLDDPEDSAFQVDTLGYDETDSVWTDSDGDRYKFENGNWLIQFSGDEPNWEEVDPRWLTDCGPYTTTPADRSPRKVKHLGESERDAEWIYEGAGFVLRYIWDPSVGKWNAWSSDRDRWTYLDSYGPTLPSHTDNFFTEVL